jgi:uncharacterized protein YkwD
VDEKRRPALRCSPWPLLGGLNRSGAVALLIVFACGSSFSPSIHSQDTSGWHSFAPAQDSLEKQTLELINRDRVAPEYSAETKGRARPLQWDDRLAAVARAHSAEMMRKGFFSHQGADGAAPAQRISAAGIQWTSVGENIAMCQTVTQAETEFMNEPRFERNHRWNILNPDYNHVGVGIVKAPDGTIHITEDFAQIR